MLRRPPRSTLDRSSAASDVYKRQEGTSTGNIEHTSDGATTRNVPVSGTAEEVPNEITISAVSYTHLRAHETVLDLVCRLLLEKKHITTSYDNSEPKRDILRLLTTFIDTLGLIPDPT